MPVPDWADPASSEELPVLRARGEGQNLEYIEEFPENARELGKEIAAFASTNPGTILLGVNNLGDLKGLVGVSSVEGRDRLLRRLEGLCAGPIQPAITPLVTFAVEGEETVLVIRVPRGSQPIYYCQKVPYVRHLTEARPAHPSEVIERVEAWIATRAVPENEVDAERTSFLSELAIILRDLLLYGNELEGRQINPGLDSLMTMFGWGAESLRALAGSRFAAEMDLVDRFESLADQTDLVARYQHFMGRESRRVFVEHVENASAAAADLKRDVLDGLNLAPAFRVQALDHMKGITRRLEGLSRRADEWAHQGRLRDLQEETSTLGAEISQLCYWGLDREDQGVLDELRAIGHELHLADMIRFTMGGGEVAGLVESIHRSLEVVNRNLLRLEGAQVADAAVAL